MGAYVGWMRAGGLAGVIFAGLVLVATFVPGRPPAAAASGNAILNYLSVQHDALLATYYLGGAFATAFAALFFGTLTALLWERGADRPGVLAAFGAIVITGALATVNSVMTASVMALGSVDLSEQGAKTLWVLSNSAELQLGLMAGVSLGLFGWVMMRMAGGWKWVGVLGLLALGVAVASYILHWAGLSGGAYALVGLGVLLVFLLWSAATGLVMLMAEATPVA